MSTTDQPVAPPAPASSGRDIEAELAQLRAQFEQLQAQASAGVFSQAPVDEGLSNKVGELRQAYADWPQPGDRFANSPQPYDLKNLGLPQPGVNRDHLPPGQPDPISPVVVSHNLPQLTAGQAGQPVALLASKLAKVGYPTTISRGVNQSFSFDESVAAAVDAFKRDFHVVEDSSAFRTAEEAARTVGPWVWEALLRATGTAVKAAA